MWYQGGRGYGETGKRGLLDTRKNAAIFPKSRSNRNKIQGNFVQNSIFVQKYDFSIFKSVTDVKQKNGIFSICNKSVSLNNDYI